MKLLCKEHKLQKPQQEVRSVLNRDVRVNSRLEILNSLAYSYSSSDECAAGSCRTKAKDSDFQF